LYQASCEFRVLTCSRVRCADPCVLVKERRCALFRSHVRFDTNDRSIVHFFRLWLHGAGGARIGSRVRPLSLCPFRARTALSQGDGVAASSIYRLFTDLLVTGPLFGEEAALITGSFSRTDIRSCRALMPPLAVSESEDGSSVTHPQEAVSAQRPENIHRKPQRAFVSGCQKLH